MGEQVNAILIRTDNTVARTHVPLEPGGNFLPRMYELLDCHMIEGITMNDPKGRPAGRMYVDEEGLYRENRVRNPNAELFVHAVTGLTYQLWGDAILLAGVTPDGYEVGLTERLFELFLEGLSMATGEAQAYGPDV